MISEEEIKSNLIEVQRFRIAELEEENEKLEAENKRLRDALKAYSFYSESHPMDNYISIRVDIHERAQEALKGE